MATKLKSYIRYDGNKKIVPGSLIFRKKPPKYGNWIEINSGLCCQSQPNIVYSLLAAE